MVTKPGVAVVGMGGYARHHRTWVEDLADERAIRYVAQVVPEMDETAYADDVVALRRSGVGIHRSLRELLAAHQGELDVVCLPVGIGLHRSMTVAALEAGLSRTRRETRSRLHTGRRRHAGGSGAFRSPLCRGLRPDVPGLDPAIERLDLRGQVRGHPADSRLRMLAPRAVVITRAIIGRGDSPSVRPGFSTARTTTPSLTP